MWGDFILCPGQGLTPFLHISFQHRVTHVVPNGVRLQLSRNVSTMQISSCLLGWDHFLSALPVLNMRPPEHTGTHGAPKWGRGLEMGRPRCR